MQNTYPGICFAGSVLFITYLGVIMFGMKENYNGKFCQTKKCIFAKKKMLVIACYLCYNPIMTVSMGNCFLAQYEKNIA